MLMKSYIYNNLSARIVSKKEYENLNNSINKYYNISEEISYYNPNLNLLTNYFKEEKTFNNKNRLLQLVKKRNRIDTVGYIFKAKIMTPYKSIYHSDIFIKELPILPLLSASTYYNHLNNSNKLIEPKEYNYYTNVYNLNATNNIEIFVNYLVSKLVELEINPHFCLYYGCIHTIFDKFTFDITDESDITDSVLNKLLNSMGNNIKFIKTRDNEYIELKDYPTYLLATEKGDLDIDYLYDRNKLDYNFIKSLIFQIFSAVISMHNIFGIKHNDLHLSNVMLKITDKTHIYYKYEQKYYKVPTFGYIVKIIDWGRATYEFNNKIGFNEIFSHHGDCFGQYSDNRINNKNRKPIELNTNKWTDIIMVSHSLLNLLEDYRDSDIGKFLYEQITDEKNKKLNIHDFSFDLYKTISKSKIRIFPRKLFNNNLFKKYKVSKDLIPKDEKIYIIDYGNDEEIDKKYINDSIKTKKRKVTKK